MAQQDLLKSFLAVTRKAQEERDGNKITELEEVVQNLKHQNEILVRQKSIMKESYQEELKEIRMKNIRLQSQNKAIKLRNSMLENIVKEEEKRNQQRFDPNQMAAFRIIQQENQQLKALLKKYVVQGKQQI